MTRGLANEFGAHRDVAPLVRTPELQGAVVIEVKAQEVVGLQQHVRELREGEANVVTVEAALDRIFRNHLVDGEVLTNVTQEIGERHRRQPVGVVQQQRPRTPGAGLEIEETAQLFADPDQILFNLLDREKRAFDDLEARVARETGTPTGESDRPVPGQLESTKCADLHEVAEVQRRGGRVKSDIGRDAAVRQAVKDRVIRRLVNETTKVPVVT